MGSQRVVALVLCAGFAGLAGILAACTACGDSDEQVELREFSAWVDRQHTAQEKLLRPIRSLETGKGPVSTFLSEIGGYRENGDLNAIQQRAKAALPLLLEIRDDLRPAHAKLRREVEAKQPVASRIVTLHGQYCRAVELRDRGLVTLSAITDLAEALLALEKVPADPAIEKALGEIARKIQGEISATASVFQNTDRPLGEDMGRLIDALTKAGLGESEQSKKAKLLVGGQLSLFRELAARIDQMRGLGHLVPILGVVETKVIPDFDRIVEEAKAVDMPAGAARTAWSKVTGILEQRAQALRRLPPLRKDIDRVTKLMQGSPAQRATHIVDDIIRRVPTIGDDMQQAGTRYERFATDLRRLRAEIL